jgi:hypothetical protein
MNSQLLFLESQQRSTEIARRADARRRERPVAAATSDGGIAIRIAREPDRGAIERLSQLEGRRLDGQMLVAETGGEVRAAVAIASGAVLADPFRRTAELVDLLQRSRAHLVDGGNPGSRLGRLAAAVRERLGSPRRAGSRVPTVLGNETTLIR